MTVVAEIKTLAKAATAQQGTERELKRANELQVYILKQN